MEKTIEDLLTIGFENVGEWKLNHNNRIYFDIEPEYLDLEHLLYAFECDSIVKYIGITENTLKNRMDLYKSGHNESAGQTNKNVYKKIKNLLELKKIVRIYILKKEANCDFFGYKISLATGIEKSLIKAFDINNNLWNSRGTNIKSKKENFQKNIIKDNDCKNRYDLIKVATISHLKYGIINLGEVPKEYLPNFGEIVNVYLGEIVFQANFINGNQQDGNNPRINSVTIGRWLDENNINVDDKFYIKICNNNSFHFYLNQI